MPTLQSIVASNNSKQQQKPVNRKGTAIRGPEGQLSAESTEEVQNLAQKAGLQATPTTPMGTAAIGGTPKQQDMAGSGAQKQAALAMSIQPGQSLQDTLRTQQARTEKTAGEQAQGEKSQALQDLGSLGDRVHQFMQGQRAQLEQATPGVEVQAATGQFNGKDLSTVGPLLEQLHADPSNMQLQLQVNQALGYDVNTQLSPDQVNQLYESSQSAISRGGAQQVADTISVNDLVQQGGFNYTPQQLSDLLGVPADQISGMNVKQLGDLINQTQQQEFTSAQTLQQKAQSGELGAAERGQARQAGREASATGVRSTEADFARLDQAVAAGDQVTFAGKQYSVEDALKDENISSTISDYMNAADGSDTRKQLEKSEPELVDFIKKNETVLADASQALQAGSKGFSEIQASNKALSDMGNNVILDPSIAKEVIPGFGELQAEKVDPNDVPVLKVASELPAEQKAQMGAELNAQAAKQPGIGTELKNLDETDLRKLDIGANGPHWQDYKTMVDQRLAAEKADKPDDMVSQLFSDVGSVDDLKNRVHQDQVFDVLSGSGGIDQDQLKGIDLTDADSLHQSLLDKIGKPSLKDAADGAQPFDRIRIGTPVVMSPQAQSVYSKLQGAAASGHITGKDMVQNNLSMDDLFYLEDQKGNAKTVNRDDLSNIINTRRDGGTLNQISRLVDKWGSDPEGLAKRLQDYYDDTVNDRGTNSKMIKDYVYGVNHPESLKNIVARANGTAPNFDKATPFQAPREIADKVYDKLQNVYAPGASKGTNKINQPLRNLAKKAGF